MSNNDQKKRHQGSSSTAEPKMCTKDCGFFGHANFGGQCSKCYHEELQQQQQNNSSVSVQAASSANDQLEEDVGPPKVTFAKSPPEKGELSARRGPFKSRPATPYHSKVSTSSSSSSSSSQEKEELFKIEQIAKRSLSSSTSSSSSSSATSSLQKLIKQKEASSSLGKSKSSGGKKQKVEANDLVKKKSSKKSSFTLSVSTSWKAKTEKLEKLSNFVAERKDEGKQASISKQKAKRPRCEKCGKGIGVIGFDCRCGHRFCVVHRHAAGHDCSFDYRAAGESELRKANPKVVADKIRKI